MVELSTTPKKETMYKELLWHIERLDILGKELYKYYIDNLVELEEEVRPK